MTPWANPMFLRCDRSARLGVGDLLRQVEEGCLIVPAYQRPRVWTLDQKRAWVGHVLSWAPCPAIVIRQVNTPDGPRDEILDGQQRLNTCAEWVRGYWPALTWDGQEAWCGTEETAQLIRRRVWPAMILPTDTTDADAIRMYLALNSGGTPHSAEELDRVRALLEVA